VAFTRPYAVRRPDGSEELLDLVDCVNVTRSPDVRQRILAGAFNRVLDPDDGHRVITIEKPFFYSDFARHQFFLVKPRQERHRSPEDSRVLERMVADVPARLCGPTPRLARVVYGLAELREKLIGADAGLEDGMVELFKVFLLHDHPFLLRLPRLRMVLDRVDDERLEFVACYDHDKRRFRLELARATADAMLARRAELGRWLARRHRHSLLARGRDHWINFWRWSPSLPSLRRLQEYATQVRAGANPAHRSAAFRSMLKYLPRGSQLPAWAKRELQVLFDWAKRRRLGALQNQLFEIRFDRELEDDWHLNDDPDDIDTLWKLLADLNVEGNVGVREINLAEDEAGGWYEPDSHDIYIGSEELYRRERFEDTVRHEVGHAVHEARRRTIDAWLARRFGWRAFETTDRGIDAFVALLGGYGEISAAHTRDIRRLLREAIGAGEDWSPPKLPVAPPAHPWNRPTFGPRLAAERTGAYWYSRNGLWHRDAERAYFLNYWYRLYMVVDLETLALINDGMPDRYAAMSPYEFFAELYALHYDRDDPKRENIPRDVSAWLDQHVGRPDAEASRRKRRRRRTPA
jgi:hypothetical protein